MTVFACQHFIENKTDFMQNLKTILSHLIFSYTQQKKNNPAQPAVNLRSQGLRILYHNNRQITQDNKTAQHFTQPWELN